MQDFDHINFDFQFNRVKNWVLAGCFALALAVAVLVGATACLLVYLF